MTLSLLTNAAAAIYLIVPISWYPVNFPGSTAYFEDRESNRHYQNHFLILFFSLLNNRICDHHDNTQNSDNPHNS